MRPPVYCFLDTFSASWGDCVTPTFLWSQISGVCVTTYLFRPPTVEQGPAGLDVLFYRYKLTRGITVIHNQDDTVVAVQTPSQDQLQGAKEFWQGGHEHYLTPTQYSLLVSAGYGSYITVT